MIRLLSPRNVVIAVLLAFLVLLPVYAAVFAKPFVVTLFTRIVILAMAAVSLNLIMGYGGMVSFGHAAYIGIGGYIVGILAQEGVLSGFVQWPLALLGSAFTALIIGVLCLRTRGVYFIMITLAFAQLLYYVAIGLDRYGGDDGLTVYTRSEFAAPLDLSNKTQFYYVCLVLLFAVIGLVWRIVNSRFGRWCRARARMTCACRRSASPPSATSSPASSSPARFVGWPARCSPTTPNSTARR